MRFTEVLERMGASVITREDSIEVSGAKKLKAIDMDMNHIPDAAMTAAVLALFADGPSTIRNVASWRVKETDRLAAMASELRKLGASVEEGADYLRITPAKLRSGVAIDTYDDHGWRGLRACRARRRACTHQRSAVRGEDIPGFLPRFQRIVG